MRRSKNKRPRIYRISARTFTEGFSHFVKYYQAKRKQTWTDFPEWFQCQYTTILSNVIIAKTIENIPEGSLDIFATIRCWFVWGKGEEKKRELWRCDRRENEQWSLDWGGNQFNQRTVFEPSTWKISEKFFFFSVDTVTGLICIDTLRQTPRVWMAQDAAPRRLREWEN